MEGLGSCSRIGEFTCTLRSGSRLLTALLAGSHSQ